MQQQIRSNAARWIASAVITVTAPAWAAEVTVQNDTPGTQTVVGGFVAGEHAGARLTSPCDGNIVAVQIVWGSAGGGAPDAIHTAIHIYDGSSFPTPGTELETLPSPYLTDGYVNEFRDIDEYGTPLIVPVTAGQQFVVTLEFAYAPNILAGDPSVIRDMNGCQAGKNVLYAIPGGWLNFCSVGLTGDIAIRAVIDCGTPTGACCLPNGDCSTETAADCTSQGGTYQGDGVSCGSVTCPQPEGACCFDPTGCLNLTEADCALAAGTWAGMGTDCATYVCNPIGACCLPDGSCVDSTDPAGCATLGGTFQGDGTVCGPETCPEPEGACCLASGGCLVLTEADCGVIPNSTWAGGGTNCDDNNTNGTADACEGDPNCPGDVNSDTVVDLTDLGILLLNFGKSPADPNEGDIDNSDAIDLTDLGILLLNFGNTCP